MSETWVTKALSTNSTPVSLSEEILNQFGVIYLEGTNAFGDKIYSYLKLQIRNYLELREKLVKGEKFFPSDYGTVLAAGKGEPSRELVSEMSVLYNLVDMPKPKAIQPSKAKMPSFAVKDVGNFWDDK